MVVGIRTAEPVQLSVDVVYPVVDMVGATGVGVLPQMYMLSDLELEREQDVERQLSQWWDMGLTQLQKLELVQHQQLDTLEKC